MPYDVAIFHTTLVLNMKIYRTYRLWSVRPLKYEPT